jgi:hypothetical protein
VTSATAQSKTYGLLNSRRRRAHACSCLPHAGRVRRGSEEALRLKQACQWARSRRISRGQMGI